MATQGPSNRDNNLINTANIEVQIQHLVQALEDYFTNGFSKMASASEEFSRILGESNIKVSTTSDEFSRVIGESASKLANTTNDLDSKCQILAEALAKLQGATDTSSANLENLTETIKQTVLSSDTIQPLMDNITDLNTKIQELNESIKENIGNSINITQSADASGGSSTDMSGRLTGGNTSATNIVNIIRGDLVKGGSGKSGSDKPSQWLGFVDNIVSSMVAGFENSKFGKISMRGVFQDVLNLALLMFGSKFGPVWGTIATGITLLAGPLLLGFFGNVLGTLAKLQVGKAIGMSNIALGRMPVNGIGGMLGRTVFFKGLGPTLTRILPLLGRFLGVLGGLAVAVYGVTNVISGIKGAQQGEKGAGWKILSGVMFVVGGIAAIVAFVMGGWVPVLIAAIGIALGGLFKWLSGRAKKEDDNNKALVDGVKKNTEQKWWENFNLPGITNGKEDGSGNFASLGKGNGSGSGKSAGVPSDIGSRGLLSHRITSGYGYRTHPTKGGTRFHHGIDLATSEGESILSPVSGEVVAVNKGHNGGYGNNVIVKDALGNFHMLAHLKDTSVKVGQMVNTSTQLGIGGHTGEGTGPHTHYEKRDKNAKFDQGFLYGGKSEDPLEYLKSPEFRVAQAKYVLDNVNQYDDLKKYLDLIVKALTDENGKLKEKEKLSPKELENRRLLENAQAYMANPTSEDYSGDSMALRAIFTKLSKVGLV